MKTLGKILAIDKEAKSLTLKVSGGKWKVGDIVNIRKGSQRSLSQNSYYWVYLEWLIDEGGLKDHGHFNPQALHLDLKSYLLAEKVFSRGEFKAIETASTSDLNKPEFSEYLLKIDAFMLEFFKIDVTPFKEFYEKHYAMC